MVLDLLRQPRTSGRRWSVWTVLTTLLLATSDYWITASNAATILPRAEELADGVELRVLPIGDSITYGAGSPFCPVGAASINCNGWRKPLYNKLTERYTNKVDFVGKLKAGDFGDTDNEGYRGEKIDEIAAHGKKGIYQAPNIVLLHVGTNDVKANTSLDDAPNRIRNLIDSVFERNPSAVVFLATIIPASYENHAETADRIPDFNKNIEGIANRYVEEGKHVVRVDMNAELEVEDLSDGLHPSEKGYQKMADKWFEVIGRASRDGIISKPGKASDPPTGTGPENCRSTPSWYDDGLLATGPRDAYTDGDFKPSWSAKKIIHDGDCARKDLRFMDLNGDGYKDYACVDEDTGSVWVSLRKRTVLNPTNPGDPLELMGWEPKETIASGAEGRKGEGVLFADLNGDGWDDYIYVDSRNGAVAGWINKGPGDKKGDPWKWKSLGIIGSQVGATTENLQMADINGDGRADFLIVSPSTGETTAWLNTGAGDMPDYYKLGNIAKAYSVSEGDYVFFGDFTGNGRADYMIVGEGGKVNGLVNRLEETTLAPAWSTVQTIFPLPDGVDQNSVRLVDMNGDGKVDYMAVGQKGKLTYWENEGTGGKYQKGEGVSLCDLDGDGTMDYFWLDHDGKGWGYLNIGQGDDKWNPIGNIAKGVGEPRDKIRMAVLTKSGRADYLVVEEESGQVKWWQNLGKDWDYDFANRGIAATGPGHTIRNQYGWTFKAENVRFADINGDGVDDYLYIHEEEGAVVYWENKGNGDATTTPAWGPAQLVADGVGVLPQDIRFADTNGDGKADYVVVGRVTGKTRSWHNLGFRDDKSVRWNKPLSFSERDKTVGHSVLIADMDGDGRDDYVSVEPNTGRLNLWRNRCWPITEDDPEPDPPGNELSYEEWCSIAGEVGWSHGQRQRIWGSAPGQLAVGEWLDRYLTEDGHSEKNWLHTIVKEYDESEDDDVEDGDRLELDFTCNSVTQTGSCGNLPSCRKFYDRGVPALYWILKSVIRVNTLAVEINGVTTEESLRNLMYLETMIEKFGHPEEGTSALDIFITAMAGGAALSAASAPVTGVFGGLGAIATLVGQLGPADEPNDRLDAEQALHGLYTSSLRGIRSFLRLSIEGEYTSKQDGSTDEWALDANDLPNLDGTTYKNPIAKHFQDGRWLYNSDTLANDIGAWRKHFSNMARQAISTSLLRSQQWVVFVASDKNTKEDCGPAPPGGNNYGGRRWVDNMCFETLVFLNDGGFKVGFADSENSNIADKFEAWQHEDYGSLVLEDLYRNTLDCALRYPNGNGKPDVKNIEYTSGGYPVCFFNLPVVRGKRSDFGNRWYIDEPESEPFINTSGREWSD